MGYDIISELKDMLTCLQLVVKVMPSFAHRSSLVFSKANGNAKMVTTSTANLKDITFIIQIT